jgi:hypothetical protein
MREYEYSIDIPHSAQRVWALMNDYNKWPEFAKPMVTGINVVKPGDEKGNGLVREVKYKLPIGLSGSTEETIYDVESGVGYTYAGTDGTVGKLRLEKLGSNSTRLHFEEKIKLKWPLSWFEGRIQKFIAQYNRKTMLNMSKWLTDHPEYQSRPVE